MVKRKLDINNKEEASSDNEASETLLAALCATIAKLSKELEELKKDKEIIAALKLLEDQSKQGEA